MSTTETAVDPADVVDAAPPPPAPKRRSNLVPAIIVAVALLGAGFMVRSADKGDSTEAAADEVDELVPGEVVPLEPVTLNLADGRYLRLGVAVELVEGVSGSEWSEHGGASRFMDLIIDRVGEHTGDDLATSEGRDDLKQLLRDGGAELFDEEFSEVYVTQLVVQ